MKRFILLTFISVRLILQAQSPMLWSRTQTSGVPQYYDQHPRLTVKADTLQVAGWVYTSTGQRMQLMKYDLNGNQILLKQYGNDSVLNNTMVDFKFDAAGNIYLLHEQKIAYFKSKVIVQKYNFNGNLLWAQQIKTLSDTSYSAHSLAVVNDTCLFVAVTKAYNYPEQPTDVIKTKQNAQLYAFNKNGVQLWKRQFDPQSQMHTYFHPLFIHNNTTYIFSAAFFSNYQQLIKVNINNHLTVHSNIGLTNGAGIVQMTPDSNFVISSFALTYKVSKVDLNGGLIWTTTIPTLLPSNVSGDHIQSLIQDSQGNIYVTGRHYGANSNTPAYTGGDMLTVKLSAGGAVIWKNRFEYGTSNHDEGYCLDLKNGSVYVGGISAQTPTTNLDYLILKIDALSGTTSGLYRYDGPSSGDDIVSAVSAFADGKVALTGLSQGNTLFECTTQLLSDVLSSATEFNHNAQLSVFPNPVNFNETLRIKGTVKGYALYDISGQLILSENGVQEAIDVKHLSPGVYLLELQTENGIHRKKIVVM